MLKKDSGAGPPACTAPALTPAEISFDRIYRKLKACQHLLAAPTAVSILTCGACMGEVAFELESLSGKIASASPEIHIRLREKAIAVAAEFHHAQQLLDRAAVLYKGWSRVLASHLRGYTRNGAPAELLYNRELLLRA